MPSLSMFSSQILNHPESFAIDEKRIQAIFQYIADEVDIVQNGILNIAFLSDKEVQVLNKQYRGIDSTTDVLSFHYFDDFSDAEGEDIAGEIIMSQSRILSQAIDHGHTSQAEFEILTIHGILHILGYDHEDDEDYVEMWAIEKVIRNKLGLSIH